MTDREVLQSLLDVARYGFHGTPYRRALDAAKRHLAYRCDVCGNLYQKNDVQDHKDWKTRTCKGTFRPTGDTR